MEYARASMFGKGIVFSRYLQSFIFVANYPCFKRLACVAIEFESGLSDTFFTLSR